MASGTAVPKSTNASSGVDKEEGQTYHPLEIHGEDRSAKCNQKREYSFGDDDRDRIQRPPINLFGGGMIRYACTFTSLVDG